LSILNFSFCYSLPGKAVGLVAARSLNNLKTTDRWTKNRWVGKYGGVLARIQRLAGTNRMIFPDKEVVDLNRESFYSTYEPR